MGSITRLLHIREVPGSNLSPETHYPNEVCQILGHDRIRSHPLEFIIH
jgi:hypothetical protein